MEPAGMPGDLLEQHEVASSLQQFNAKF